MNIASSKIPSRQKIQLPAYHCRCRIRCSEFSLVSSIYYKGVVCDGLNNKSEGVKIRRKNMTPDQQDTKEKGGTCSR